MVFRDWGWLEWGCKMTVGEGLAYRIMKIGFVEMSERDRVDCQGFLIGYDEIWRLGT